MFFVLSRQCYVKKYKTTNVILCYFAINNFVNQINKINLEILFDFYAFI